MQRSAASDLSFWLLFPFKCTYVAQPSRAPSVLSIPALQRFLFLTHRARRRRSVSITSNLARPVGSGPEVCFHKALHHMLEREREVLLNYLRGRTISVFYYSGGRCLMTPNDDKTFYNDQNSECSRQGWMETNNLTALRLYRPCEDF